MGNFMELDITPVDLTVQLPAWIVDWLKEVALQTSVSIDALVTIALRKEVIGLDGSMNTEEVSRLIRAELMQLARDVRSNKTLH